MYDTLSHLHSFSQGSERTQYLDQLATVALPVTADCVSVPERAGAVDPTKYLSPERAKIMKDSSCLVLPEDEWPCPLPDVCHRVSPTEEARLRKLLIDSNMVGLVRAEEVPCCPVSGRRLVAGLFGVPHKPGFLRLIFDRRMANATEMRLFWSRLPYGSLLTQSRVGANQAVRGSGDDVSNYFYHLAHDENWHNRCAVGKLISGAEAAALGGRAGCGVLYVFQSCCHGGPQRGQHSAGSPRGRPVFGWLSR